MTGQGQILVGLLLWIMAPFFIVVLLVAPMVLMTMLKRGWRDIAMRGIMEPNPPAREE